MCHENVVYRHMILFLASTDNPRNIAFNGRCRDFQDFLSFNPAGIPGAKQDLPHNPCGQFRAYGNTRYAPCRDRGSWRKPSPAHILTVPDASPTRLLFGKVNSIYGLFFFSRRLYESTSTKRFLIQISQPLKLLSSQILWFRTLI